MDDEGEFFGEMREPRRKRKQWPPRALRQPKQTLAEAVDDLEQLDGADIDRELED